MEKYTIKEKLDGKDLHGLSCRIPTPTPEQAECSHTRTEDIDEGYECDFIAKEKLKHFINQKKIKNFPLWKGLFVIYIL